MSRPLPNGGLADLIAQTIRRVDGNHTLSAGTLGEAIAEEIGVDPSLWLAGIFQLYRKNPHIRRVVDLGRVPPGVGLDILETLDAARGSW